MAPDTCCSACSGACICECAECWKAKRDQVPHCHRKVHIAEGNSNG